MNENYCLGETMGKLKKLRPERVFYYFEEICAIPHGSGDTEKISDYCEEFAKRNNLEYVREEIGNVIIRKPATLGKENCPAIILQGHLDMVCEKEANLNFDFQKDSLNIDIDGDFVFAHGTTLGGDDGIAVAMCLALLEAKDISHPALEVLFTVDEETGMYGAQALDGSLLSGRRLINIDSEEEGIFTVSCAGGVRAELTLPIEYEVNKMPCYKVTVEGLIGGHSGVEIHKGRLNSNKVAGAFLSKLNNYRLISINGGMKDNAIPVFTQMIIATNEDLSFVADEFVKNTVVETDPDLKINIKQCDKCEKCLTAESSEKTAQFLSTVPNGIIKWSDHIENLVETSLNLGVLKTKENVVTASFGVRSSVNDDKLKLIKELDAFIRKFGGKMKAEGYYPAWEYCEESALRDTMCEVYEEITGNAPLVVAIHAGLECGLLSEKLPGLEAVSIGPNMFDIHTPRERLSVSSVERVYNYLIKLLEVM